LGQASGAVNRAANRRSAPAVPEFDGGPAIDTSSGRSPRGSLSRSLGSVRRPSRSLSGSFGTSSVARSLRRALALLGREAFCFPFSLPLGPTAGVVLITSRLLSGTRRSIDQLDVDRRSDEDPQAEAHMRTPRPMVPNDEADAGCRDGRVDTVQVVIRDIAGEITSIETPDRDRARVHWIAGLGGELDKVADREFVTLPIGVVLNACEGDNSGTRGEEIRRIVVLAA
jgi:hypothetical protein